MSAIGAALERDGRQGAAKLRQLMVIGVLFATALVALLVYFQWLKLRHERAAREAQSQTRDILGTVKEGLFLIDSDFRIGTGALERTRRPAAARTVRRTSVSTICSFELVPEKTLDTARKYVKLFWGERANENLIKSINPLAEVEVRFRPPRRATSAILEFDFHRVKGDGGARQVLVSVTDVTSRVLLARELQQSQASNAVQMDVLLGILKLEPQQLIVVPRRRRRHAQPINTVLKVPAREDAGFRRKIDELFREMHKVKGEAAALGIESVESRAHAFEDTVARAARAAGTGRQRLPAAGRPARRPVRAREVVAGAHAAARRAALEPTGRGYDDCAPAQATAANGAAAPGAANVRSRSTDPLSANPGRQIASSLETLAQRVATDHGKQVEARSRVSSRCRRTTCARCVASASSSCATLSCTASRA